MYRNVLYDTPILLREIFRFEFAYQVRRLSTWLFFAVLVAFAFLLTRGNFLADALYADFFLDSPFVVAVVTVFGSLIWLLVAAAVAGEAAARDVQTGGCIPSPTPPPFARLTTWGTIPRCLRPQCGGIVPRPYSSNPRFLTYLALLCIMLLCKLG